MRPMVDHKRLSREDPRARRTAHGRPHDLATAAQAVVQHQTASPASSRRSSPSASTPQIEVGKGSRCRPPAAAPRADQHCSAQLRTCSRKQNPVSRAGQSQSPRCSASSSPAPDAMDDAEATWQSWLSGLAPWAAVTRVTWRCQPVNEAQPAAHSHPSAIAANSRARDEPDHSARAARCRTLSSQAGRWAPSRAVRRR